jgi:hypothetical protein
METQPHFLNNKSEKKVQRTAEYLTVVAATRAIAINERWSIRPMNELINSMLLRGILYQRSRKEP